MFPPQAIYARKIARILNRDELRRSLCVKAKESKFTFLFLRIRALIIIRQLRGEMNVWLEIKSEAPAAAQNQENPPQEPASSNLTPGGLEAPAVLEKRRGRRWSTWKLLYNWNKGEDKKYLIFLQRNRGLFELSDYDRKCIKINVRMSQAIQTRSAAQCHTHHQKMMLKYGAIDEIIRNLGPLMEARRRRQRAPRPSLGRSNPNQSCLSLQEIRTPNKQPEWYQYISLFSSEEYSLSFERRPSN